LKKGTIRFQDGEINFLEFENYENGILILSNEEILEGIFINEECSLIKGSLTFPDGKIHNGKFFENRFLEEGKKIYIPVNILKMVLWK